MWKAKENISIVFILHITVLKAVPCKTIGEWGKNKSLQSQIYRKNVTPHVSLPGIVG